MTEEIVVELRELISGELRAVAAEWMLASGYRHLPVVEDERLIGMASIKDILRAIAGETVR